ncbi:MAG: hypothetical protein DCC75_08570 [Proteobacteria bacterium]|nr:MAG: hypothetical protein DCC75_08570 [Pseudomonadota bacterium]
MLEEKFLKVAEDLELAGLVWSPEIGDEVAERVKLSSVSILVDPQGMTPDELRTIFLWLPTVEQMVLQLEARQAVLSHTGLELSRHSMFYKTILETSLGPIESKAASLRMSVGLALRTFLLNGSPESVH